MNPKAWAGAVLAAAVLLGPACGDDGGGDEETARIDSGQPGDGGSVGDEVTTTPTTDDSGDGGDGDGGDEQGGAEVSDRTPQEQDLGIDVRHPTGVSVVLSHLGFEGRDVIIDAEVVNASRDTITFHFGNYSSQRLRLVDDAGQEYNLIEVEEDQSIDLAPGETLEAAFAFRGPLHGEPERLWFVTNEETDNVETFDPEAESDSTIFPKFVIPIELEWG